MKWFYSIVMLSILSCQAQSPIFAKKNNNMKNTPPKVTRTEAEWKEMLDPESYVVLRLDGTERPNTGKYNIFDEPGKYYCKGCENYLFSSDQKFSSSCGWPSFFDVDEGAVKYLDDYTGGRHRTEVRCTNCDSHLGHVFKDGPTDKTGLRYCINSVALNFEPIIKE